MLTFSLLDFLSYNGNSIYIYVILIVIIIIGYYIYFVPFTWIENDYAVNKKTAVNRNRRIRQSEEFPPAYPNGWFSIMEADELKVEEVRTVSYIGEQFAVYRSKSGKVYVIDAYCPHLGANFGAGGRVIGEDIQCPFHQLNFSGENGSCTGVEDGSCYKVKPSAKVRTWKSIEIGGHVMVWYHTDPTVEPWPLPNIEEIHSGHFIYQGKNEFYINSHIQDIPENGADLAHFNSVHDINFLANYLRCFGNLAKHHWSASWEPVTDYGAKHIAKINISHSMQLPFNIRIMQMNVVAEQHGPSYVQMFMKSPTFGKVIVIQTVTPVTPILQKVVHRFYSRRRTAPFAKTVVFGESIMFKRDIAIWNNKIFLKNPYLLREDSGIKVFRNWYKQFYSTNSKSFREAYNNYDW